MVTAGLTQGLSLAGELFFSKGDSLILPNQIWGNYRLLYQIRSRASLKMFEFFKGKGFNLQAFEGLLSEEITAKGRANILFNFPNNPPGYALTRGEMEAVKEVLSKYLNQGAKILTFLDDAYYGLFFEDDIPSESFFSHLATLHPNMLAVKLDGMTKEYFAWGYRVGFITFGNKNLKESYPALEKKAAGAHSG